MNLPKDTSLLITYLVGLLAFVTILSINIDDDYAVRVGSERFSQEIVATEADRLEYFFKQSEQDYTRAELEAEVADRLVNRYIVSMYAQENEIVITDQEIDDYYQTRVESFGSEEELLEALYSLYGITKEQYLEELTYDLLRNAVVPTLDEPYEDWLETQIGELGVDIKL